MIITRYMDMPLSVKGITVKDDAGDFNIYINPSLSYDEQLKAYKHEIKHISMGHFYTLEPVKLKEAQI